MTFRFKNILVFGLSLLVAGGIYSWFFTLNKGSVGIITNQTDYSIETEDGKKTCPKDPCVFSMKTGPRSLSVTKEGFYPLEKEVTVIRGNIETIQVELKRIPTLAKSNFLPRGKKSVPSGIKSSLSSWNRAQDQLAYLDPEDSKLKIWSEKKSKTITILRNLSDQSIITWSPDENWLFIHDNQEIYWMNIKEASRKKTVLDFNPEIFLWNPDNKSLLLNDSENNTFKFTLANQQLDRIELNIDLNLAKWSEKEELIVVRIEDNGISTIISSIDKSLQSEEAIMTKYNFPVSGITTDDTNKVYLYNSDSKSWYSLDY